MHLDARKLKKQSSVEADICVVGAGPAGFTLAREFLGSHQNVVVLESGGPKLDRKARALNEGESSGDSYSGLMNTRHRQVGGTPNIWNTPVGKGFGAKYVPLDPWDLEERADIALSGWPFDFSHLQPFYERAQEVCGLGPFRYRGEAWATTERPAPELHPNLKAGVYHFGRRTLFTRDYPEEIETSSNVQLYHHATVLRLERASGHVAGANPGRINAAVIAGRPGQEFRVRARTFVLAAGAVENARILLVSGGLGNDHDWVGRCFMEHPRDYSMVLRPRSRAYFNEAGFFDPYPSPDGFLIGGRIGLSEGSVVSEGLPNASVTLLPKPRERNSLVEWATRLWFCPHSSGYTRFGGGYGWSRMKNPGRWLDGFRMVLNTEQRPDPENRITLSQAEDPLGVPRPRLHWRWTKEEQEKLDRLREKLAVWIEQSGLGRVEVEMGLPPDPNASHHAGTTRMHSDPSKGVVDPDSRVFGTENLFLAGASVFPTVGYANPTLTIVAMALRLADHLRAGG